jgi:hypothetical protein
MFDALAKLLPSAATLTHQIAPSVVATLIAAGLISGYNHTFSGHLTQPRMAALHAAEPTDAVDVTSAPAPAAKPAAPWTEFVTIDERRTTERLADKDTGREAGKDEMVKLVTAPVAAPAVAAAPAAPAAPAATAIARTAALAPAAKPQRTPRLANPAAVAVAPLPPTVPVTTSVAVAPVAAEPPPVIVAAPPQTYAIAPQGAHEPPVTEAPPPSRGALGAIANALNPVQLFNRAREFGEKIEQTGNDLLPNIRQ